MSTTLLESRSDQDETHLAISISSWIIQDGNYPNFGVGDQLRFALEFHPKGAVIPVNRNTPLSYQLLPDGNYSLIVEVISLHPGKKEKNSPLFGTWVVDFGFRAYQTYCLLPNVQVGDRLSFQASLGIDPCFYQEYLYREPGMPSLIYFWEFLSIQLLKAPWIEVAPRSFTKDLSKATWLPITKTNAEEDDDFSAEYTASIKPLSREPTYPLNI